MYACPQCKGPLLQFNCAALRCALSFSRGYPLFHDGISRRQWSDDPTDYDDIYRHHEMCGSIRGRSEQFMAYFSDLARSLSSENVLEIGCGEGILLASLSGVHKFGIDPSVQALIRAKQRSGAECAVARAEALPFPSETFDLVVAVGVMEHFEDPEAGDRRSPPSPHKVRTLPCALSYGHGVARQARAESERVRISSLPAKALVSWITKKARHPIVQPLRKSYTQESARELLERHGLTVTHVISCDRQPAAPLAGRHVIIFIAKQAAN